MGVVLSSLTSSGDRTFRMTETNRIKSVGDFQEEPGSATIESGYLAYSATDRLEEARTQLIEIKTIFAGQEILLHDLELAVGKLEITFQHLEKKICREHYFLLEKLPLDVLGQILEQILVYKDAMIMVPYTENGDTRNSAVPRHVLSLLAVSHSVRATAADVFYGYNTFCVRETDNGWAGFQRWLYQIGKRNHTRIRRLYIDLTSVDGDLGGVQRPQVDLPGESCLASTVPTLYYSDVEYGDQPCCRIGVLEDTGGDTAYLWVSSFGLFKIAYWVNLILKSHIFQRDIYSTRVQRRTKVRQLFRDLIKNYNQWRLYLFHLEPQPEFLPEPPLHHLQKTIEYKSGDLEQISVLELAVDIITRGDWGDPVARSYSPRGRTKHWNYGYEDGDDGWENSYKCLSRKPRSSPGKGWDEHPSGMW